MAEAEELKGSEVEKKAVEARDSPEWTKLRQCVLVVSLCRVRDGMGTGLEGVMGLLRILKRILKAADPELDRFSSSSVIFGYDFTQGSVTTDASRVEYRLSRHYHFSLYLGYYVSSLMMSTPWNLFNECLISCYLEIQFPQST